MESFYFHLQKRKKWEVAVIAGGCFWGVQELYRTQKGVLYSEVGYTGGLTKNAQYTEVKTGTTGHAEAVRILFDPTVTSYKEILFYFFKIHDPTTTNRQGNDIGTQYRSEIFYLNEAQKKTAQEVIKRVDDSKNGTAQLSLSLKSFMTFQEEKNITRIT